MCSPCTVPVQALISLLLTNPTLQHLPSLSPSLIPHRYIPCVLPRPQAFLDAKIPFLAGYLADGITKIYSCTWAESCRSIAGRKAAAWAIDQEKASASSTGPTAKALQAKITALCKVECPKGYAPSGAEPAPGECVKLCAVPLEGVWLTPRLALNLVVGGMLGYFLIGIVDSCWQSELVDPAEADRNRKGGGDGGGGGSGSRGRRGRQFVPDDGDEVHDRDDEARTAGNFHATSSAVKSVRTPRSFTRASHAPRPVRPTRNVRKRPATRSTNNGKRSASESPIVSGSKSRGRSTTARPKVR